MSKHYLSLIILLIACNAPLHAQDDPSVDTSTPQMSSNIKDVYDLGGSILVNKPLQVSGFVKASTGTFVYIGASTLTVLSGTVFNLTVTGDLTLSGSTRKIPQLTWQVISATTTSSTTSSGTSYTSTALTASITPKFATSLIRVIVVGQIGNLSPATSGSAATLFRGTQDIGPSNGNGICAINEGTTVAASFRVPCSWNLYDNPATTSSLTYTVKIKSSSAADTTWNGDGMMSFMILEEVMQ